MKPVTEVRQETAEVLGNAVAEVARRAIRPELDPFKQSLDSLVGNLEGHAETLGEQVRAEKKELEALNKQLGEVVATGKSQAEAAADMQARIQEVRERLDAVSGELAATRDDQATTVAALNSLRDEVLGWMRASNEQAERLASVLGRAEDLADALGNQARAFTDFANTLSGQVDARATEVLQGIVEARADAAREASELKSVLGNGFKGQDASSRAAASDVVAKVDAGVKSITGALASARQAGATEIAALGAADQTRQDAATAEVRTLVEALRSEMAAKIESGFLQAIERLESGSQRAVDNVAGLRTTAETKLASLQTGLETVLERLSARQEDHGRELAKTGQTAGRVFRLAIANLILVLVALAAGGVTLWMAAR
jgi:predicted  nucleic acid-binding Zn-ribbon protein